MDLWEVPDWGSEAPEAIVYPRLQAAGKVGRKSSKYNKGREEMVLERLIQGTVRLSKHVNVPGVKSQQSLTLAEQRSGHPAADRLPGSGKQQTTDPGSVSGGKPKLSRRARTSSSRRNVEATEGETQVTAPSAWRAGGAHAEHEAGSSQQAGLEDGKALLATKKRKRRRTDQPVPVSTAVDAGETGLELLDSKTAVRDMGGGQEAAALNTEAAPPAIKNRNKRNKFKQAVGQERADSGVQAGAAESAAKAAAGEDATSRQLRPGKQQQEPALRIASRTGRGAGFASGHAQACSATEAHAGKQASMACHEQQHVEQQPTKKRKPGAKRSARDLPAPERAERLGMVGRDEERVLKGAREERVLKGARRLEARPGKASMQPQATGKPAQQQQRGGGLLERMRAQLSGGHFRWLNEALYTRLGEEALELMRAQPQLFAQYHEGFQRQTARWPVQPLQAAAAYLRSQPKRCVVADFGCGDAQLADMAPQETVVSLDLVAARPGVIACNMAHTPLEAASVDIAIFCLALMGTDYPSFLAEAHRVLKPGGHLWVAEVRSRFSGGRKQGEDFRPFLSALQALGFASKSVDASNSHFVTFELQKTGAGRGGAGEQAWPKLKPCTYKKR